MMIGDEDRGGGYERRIGNEGMSGGYEIRDEREMRDERVTP
jgi:hypothetical protein